MSWAAATSLRWKKRLTRSRLPLLCAAGHCLLDRHDLPRGPALWTQEPADLYLHLQHCRIRLHHGCQGCRYCRQANLCRLQPIHPPQHLRLYPRHSRLHPDADELLQQGSESIQHKHVRQSLASTIWPFTDLSSVNPLYYVTFTTCTLVASFILFRGFNTSDAVNTISLLCGFLTIFTGVYLLNLSREDPEGHNHMQLNGNGSRFDLDGIPTDPMSGPLTRRSMQARRSSEAQHRRSNSLNLSFAGRRSGDHDREALMHNYDVEATNGGFSLGDLADSDDEDAPRQNGKAKVSHERLSFNKTGR